MYQKKNSYIKIGLYLFLLWGFFFNFSIAANFDKWQIQTQSESFISYKNPENYSFSYLLLRSEETSAKVVAESLNKELKGQGVRAVPAIRGWIFNFTTDKPCAGVVKKLSLEKTYEYVFFCGEISQEDLEELLKNARSKLFNQTK